MRNASQKLELLIIEDSEHDVELIRHHLQQSLHQPFRLRHIIQPKTALNVLDHEPIDFLIVDNRLLDEKKGTSLLRNVRSRGHHVPAVLTTGYGDRQVQQTVRDLENTRFLHKNELSVGSLKRILSKVFDGVSSSGGDALISVLMFDDNPRDAKLIRSYLNQLPEYEIDFLYTDERSQALNWIQSWSPDLVFVDYLFRGIQNDRLVVETGFDFVRDVRRSGFDGELVLITAFGGPEIEHEAYENGISMYLSKNQLSLNGLRAVVRKGVDETSSDVGHDHS